MPFKFNPFSGALDLVNNTSGGVSEDFHSGWYAIPITSSVTVLNRKQMVVFGELELDGTLNVDGQLVLED